MYTVHDESAEDIALVIVRVGKTGMMWLRWIGGFLSERSGSSVFECASVVR